MTALARVSPIALVVAAAVAAVAVQGAGGGVAAVRCTLPGVHYVGTTSQHKPVCITITKDGAKLTEYAYGFRDSCGAAGESRTTNSSRGYVAPVSHGGFSHAVSPPSYFKGVVRGATASGTLRSRSTVVGIGTCDTGAVHWTAHRK